MGPTRRDVDRMAAGTAIVLMIAASQLNAACASSGRRPGSGLLQLTSGPPRPGVVPGNWDRVDALQPGSSVMVTLERGDRVQGEFRALDRDMLVVADRAGRELQVPRSDVCTIVALGVKDNLGNGTLIGAGTGLAAALTILAVLGSEHGYVLPSAKWGAPLLLAGIGGLIGVLVDRAHEGKEVLYMAP